MERESTELFLKERENKLGSPILWKSYATWHNSLRGEEKEYGVFVYTDGNTLVFKDFERTPTLMGIPVSAIKKAEYRKYEVLLSIKDIREISTVTKSSAMRSVRAGKKMTRKPNIMDKAFRKLVSMVEMDSGELYFFELMDRKEFENKIMDFRKGE